jgi:MoaA/NifB/PqqE/SkfB family radical SAM enzyme
VLNPDVLNPDLLARGVRARRGAGVRIRWESFGAIVYVPARDHFFALDARYAAALRSLRDAVRPVTAGAADRVRTLAEYGIVATEPATPQRAFYGRSYLGDFGGAATTDRPLVVNCFTTAHCPLRCAYCHADDLMTGYRDDEEDSWLRDVIRVAAATPAMVGVVTGGEPLSRPDRAERLIAALAEDKAVVLDTSGVGDFPRLLPLLRRHRVHVRVSLDSAEPRANDALRPINRRYLAPFASSHAHATDTIRRAVADGLPCSVQTVVTSRNATADDLLRLRDHLVDAKVGTWALHVVVPAGKAGDPGRARLLSDESTAPMLAHLVRRTAAEGAPIDIRVTDTHRAPNSVLLISARGELSVQDPDGGRKTVLRMPRLFTRRHVLSGFRRYIDPDGHAGRYLNGSLDLMPPDAVPALRPELPAAAGGR